MGFELDDIPDLTHWKQVMEFTIEQAALLIAGIDPLETRIWAARSSGHPRWKKASATALAITTAIRQGLIAPVVCRGGY